MKKQPINLAAGIGLLLFFSSLVSAQAPNEYTVDKTVTDHADAGKAGSLAWCVQQAKNATSKPVRIRLPGPADYYTSKSILMESDIHLVGRPGARILSGHRGNPHNYYGILTTSPKQKIVNLVIESVGFKNTDAVGLYGLAILNGGGENVRVERCEAEGCGLVFAQNIKYITVSENFAYSPAIEKINVFDDHHHGIYLGGLCEDVIIRHNRILGRFCHGIAVVAEDVIGKGHEDPDRPMLGKRVLIDGNTVRTAVSWDGAGGGIWFSTVQDCRVVNNHVEGYGDVGIDFEGCRNAVASANVLVNNNKNLALYGNCKNILFSNNVVSMNSTNRNCSAAFFNSYSNGYPGTTNLKNTDIAVIGNTFIHADGKTKPGWPGGVILGTAKRMVFKDNVFTNCFIQGAFCDDLETVEISNNTFHNDFARRTEATPVISLAVSERDKKTRQPAKNYLITANRFTCVNDAALPNVIQINTCSNINGKFSSPFSDLNVFLTNNIFQRETMSRPAVFFQDNYLHDHFLKMSLACIVRNNIANCDFVFDIPKVEPKKEIKLLVSDNVIVKNKIPPSAATQSVK